MRRDSSPFASGLMLFPDPDKWSMGRRWIHCIAGAWYRVPLCENNPDTNSISKLLLLFFQLFINNLFSKQTILILLRLYYNYSFNYLLITLFCKQIILILLKETETTEEKLHVYVLMEINYVNNIRIKFMWNIFF